MSQVNPKFAHNINVEFFNVLKDNVNAYFEKQKKSRFGNWNMVVKTIFMFSLYLAPYFLLLFGVLTNPFAVVFLWILMGFGMAGIGLSVMHDANHGSYSRKKWVNKYLGYSMNFIGANAELWKLQHNVLHHTYTNVHGMDEDINAPSVLRFSPYDKKYWIHKYQHLYFWFLYGLQTLPWITTKEFGQMARYQERGLIKGKKKVRKFFAQIIAWKLFYYAYMLVIPLVLFPAPIWLTLIGFFALHFTSSFILSLIFQTAHVMPECEFPVANEEGVMENNWAIHEMMTTANYAPQSRLFSWYIGGLNYQIEHHLFTNICHVHYRNISKIVSATAKEFGVPYNTYTTFSAAVWSHAKMLYKLGRWELAPVAAGK